MPRYVLSSTELSASNIIPAPLIGYITPQQWASICNANQMAEAKAHSYACIVEVIIAILFVFPFIFCCHPCMYLCVAPCTKDGEVQKVNNTIFSGQPVLSRFDLNIVINTDYLLQTQINPVSIPVQQVYIQQPTPMAEAVYVDAPITKLNPAMEVPVNTQTSIPATTMATQNCMVVTVPINAAPGQTIQVTAPNGSIVQVVLPHNAVPGQEMTVYY